MLAHTTAAAAVVATAVAAVHMRSELPDYTQPPSPPMPLLQACRLGETATAVAVCRCLLAGYHVCCRLPSCRHLNCSWVEVSWARDAVDGSRDTVDDHQVDNNACLVHLSVAWHSPESQHSNTCRKWNWEEEKKSRVISSLLRAPAEQSQCACNHEVVLIANSTVTMRVPQVTSRWSVIPYFTMAPYSQLSLNNELLRCYFKFYLGERKVDCSRLLMTRAIRWKQEVDGRAEKGQKYRLLVLFRENYHLHELYWT